jgi:hypothetical protein
MFRDDLEQLLREAKWSYGLKELSEGEQASWPRFYADFIVRRLDVLGWSLDDVLVKPEEPDTLTDLTGPMGRTEQDANKARSMGFWGTTSQKED